MIEIPGFDDFVLASLKAVGSPSGLVVAVGAWFAIASWVSFVREGHRTSEAIWYRISHTMQSHLPHMVRAGAVHGISSAVFVGLWCLAVPGYFMVIENPWSGIMIRPYSSPESGLLGPEIFSDYGYYFESLPGQYALFGTVLAVIGTNLGHLTRSSTILVPVSLALILLSLTAVSCAGLAVLSILLSVFSDGWTYEYSLRSLAIVLLVLAAFSSHWMYMTSESLHSDTHRQ
jgi:hypothetical protein